MLPIKRVNFEEEAELILSPIRRYDGEVCFLLNEFPTTSGYSFFYLLEAVVVVVVDLEKIKDFKPEILCLESKTTKKYDKIKSKPFLSKKSKKIRMIKKSKRSTVINSGR